VAFAVAILLIGAPSALGQEYEAGSDGLGDPFFPQAGNGGYDTTHYGITLDYDQPANFLEGTAEIDATATQNLRRFNLDLRDFYAVSSVMVNGERAQFDRPGQPRPGQQELAISPADPLDAGSDFTVRVDYSGNPEPIKDPDKSIEGWIPTDDGGFVVNEPQGSPGWFPCNDNPRDKATYDFAVTVPRGNTVMANGKLISHTSVGDKETWRWSEDSPMASYLATATNGEFLTDFYRAKGLPMYDAVDPLTRRLVDEPPNPDLAFERLEPQAEIIDYFKDLYGPYPFSTGGGIIDWAPNVFYSLESQSRANYWRIPPPPDPSITTEASATVVHEIAHQWFGNAVSLQVWPDIWLNEGFATFSEWIYAEDHGGPTAAETFDDLYATSESDRERWFPAPAALQRPSQLFHTPVYDRGGMTLQALREKVGDDTFFGILRAWYADNRSQSVTTDETVTTADFIALTKELTTNVSDEELDEFFRVWLFEEGKPESW
jgi:aminopeptidase N